MATSPQQTVDTALPGDQSDATLPGLKEMREAGDSWRIAWHDGSSRETTITAMAWYAREFDEDATVTPLTDE